MDQSLEVSLKGSEFRKFMEHQFASVREKYDLKKIEIDILYYLSKHHSHDTPTDIHHQLMLNRGHVSQAIDSLYKKGYILPIPDLEDRRYIHYEITGKAAPAIEEINRIRQSLDQDTFKDIPQEEVEVFQRVLKKIKANLREMLE